MDPSWCSGLQDKILISGDIYLDSGDSWMYPDPNVPLWEIPPPKKKPYIWVFPSMVLTPPFTPQVLIIFVGKNHWLLGKPTISGNPIWVFPQKYGYPKMDGL